MISKYTMAMAGHCIYDDENKCFATSIIADFGTVGDTVWVTGYPSDLGNCKYMYKCSGNVESVTDSLIKYDADTYRGQSGSPVYYKSGGKLYSYATHIYGGNYGRRLSSGLMTWLSDNGFLK